MSPRHIYGSLAKLGPVLSTSVRLFLSGIFQPAEYCKLIPGLNGKALKAYVHVIRHGVRNSAFLSRDPISAWLIPEIISGRISALEAREIRRSIQNGDDTKVSADFYCTRDYLSASFKACLDVLAETSPDYHLKFCHLMLRGPYHLSEIAPFMDALHDRYEAGIWSGNLDAQKMYRDLALATGSPAQTMVAITQRIVNLAAAQQNSSSFYLGFQETSAAPPTARIKETYGDYAVFQDMAARNALRQENFLALQKQGQGWAIIHADPKYIGMCIPPPEIWVNSAPFAKTVIQNFKGFMGLLDPDAPIVPLLFPYARDLTRMAFPCEQLTSYHSFAEGRDDILHYKESSLKGLCSFDRGGYSGSASTWKDTLDLTRSTEPSQSVSAYTKLHKKGLLSKYANSGDINRPELSPELRGQKYIFIALQVSDDSAARWHSMDPMDMVRWCREAAKAEDTLIVVKPHPKDVFSQFGERLEALSKTQKNILVTTHALEPLLENAALVLTANSGVGLEALLYGKPVITTGLSEYRSATCYAPEEGTLKSAISDLLESPSQDRDYGWLNRYFATNLWNGTDDLPSDHVISRFIAND